MADIDIKSTLINLAVRALSESVSVHIMETLVKKLVPDYDLYQRTGFPPNHPIPNRDAARQIIMDMKAMSLFPQFINVLIQVHTEGLMGRTYSISYIKEIIKELYEYGYIYDKQNKLFVENASVRKTRNWGALREGEEYLFSFLRCDIVGNSELVRTCPEEDIRNAYDDLRGMVERVTDKRNGRIWNWEGDGGMVAFYFSNKALLATLCGMELVHDLFIYNAVQRKLQIPLKVRLAIHHGPCTYLENVEDLKKSDTIKKLIEIESKYTQPNTLTISNNVALSLDDIVSSRFTAVQAPGATKYYNYSLKWED